MILKRIAFAAFILLTKGPLFASSSEKEVEEFFSGEAIIQLRPTTDKKKTPTPEEGHSCREAQIESSFYRLPNEIVRDVFGYLPLDSLINVARCCKWFSEMLAPPSGITCIQLHLQHKILPPLISKQEYIQRLVCSKNSLWTHLLPQQKALQILEFAHYPLEPAHLPILGHYVKRTTTLRQLYFFKNSIDVDGLQGLSDALVQNKSLTLLAIYHNMIEPEGAQVLRKVLETKTHKLTHLYLPFATLRLRGVQAVCAALRTNTTLTHLNLDQTSSGAEGGEALGEALKENSTLTHLWFNRNMLCNEGAAALSKGLELNKSLVSLHLKCNSITNKGGQALAQALTGHPKLQVLDLSKNVMGDEAGFAFAELLETNPSLQELNLRETYLKDVVGMAFALQFTQNKTLTRLELGENPIGQLTSKAFSLLLKDNTSLNYLQLSSHKTNPVKDQTRQGLKEVLKTHPKLKIFYDYDPLQY